MTPLDGIGDPGLIIGEWSTLPCFPKHNPRIHTSPPPLAAAAPPPPPPPAPPPSEHEMFHDGMKYGHFHT